MKNKTGTVDIIVHIQVPSDSGLGRFINRFLEEVRMWQRFLENGELRQLTDSSSVAREMFLADPEMEALARRLSVILKEQRRNSKKQPAREPSKSG